MPLVLGGFFVGWGGLFGGETFRPGENGRCASRRNTRVRRQRKALRPSYVLGDVYSEGTRCESGLQFEEGWSVGKSGRSSERLNDEDDDKGRSPGRIEEGGRGFFSCS